MTEHVEGQIAKCPCRLGGQETAPGPSQDLLDRALVGWERFIASIERPADD